MVTFVPVRISPPSDRRYAAIASATACDPPAANGQPTVWPLEQQHRPERRRQRVREREERMRRAPREHRARRLVAQVAADERGGRQRS